MEFINPEILSVEGEQTDAEGCLSIPDTHYELTRPMKVRFTAQDRRMEKKEYVAEGLFARAICHEADHLDGVLFVDRLPPGAKKIGD